MAGPWDHVALIAAPTAMLGLALAVPAWLALTGRGAAGRRWVVVVGGALAVVAALKLAGHAWTLADRGAWLRSPSGHVAAGCLIWGGIAAMAGAGRLPSLAIGLAIAAVLAPARILGGQHTLAEALLGSAIGLAALGLLLRLPAAPAGWRARPFLLAMAVVALAAAPWRLAPEPVIEAMAAALLRGLGPGRGP